ncbi:hypothetical protein CSB37_04240 [bacterium DOLZORAL124_38_8]|nr:MAG: hypothetical protein CSB37_04240 [bacterium DOLZORAL124_38_8]
MKTFIQYTKKLLVLAALPLLFGLNLPTTFAGYPTQVPNVQATVEGDTVKLTWDDATSDDDAVIKYKIYYGKESVKEEGQDYSELPIEVGTGTNKKEYVFENLEKEVPYFFAITAIDSSERESQNYSIETTATILATTTPTEENTTETTDKITEPKEEEKVEEPKEDPTTTEKPEITADPVDTAPTTKPNTTVSPKGETTINEEKKDAPEKEPTVEPFEPSAPADTEAPTPAKDIQVINHQTTATITWVKSDSNDVAFQRLAYKTGTDSWQYKALSTNDNQTKLKTEAHQKYQVKIISTDTAGNKSESEVKSFSTDSLAKAGPTSTLAIIIALGFLALVLFTAKRRA